MKRMNVKSTRLACLALAATLHLAPYALAADAPAVIPPDDATWQAFMARHDLIFPRAPMSDVVGGAPELGNGLLGARVLTDPLGGRFFVRVERGSCFAESGNAVKERSVVQYSFGAMELKPAGKILNVATRLDLWNATAESRIDTTAGTLQARVFIPATRDVVVIRVRTSGNEKPVAVDYRGHNAPAVLQLSPYPDDPAKTLIARKEGDLEVRVQPNVVAGERTVVWCEERPSANEQVFYIALGFSRKGPSAADPIAQIAAARKQGVASLYQDHCEEWHRLYRRHFLSWPDSRLVSRYWLQIYLLSSVFRPDGPIAINGGRFVDAPQCWDHLTTDWNAGSQYPVAFAANLYDRIESVVRSINGHIHYLNANVGGPGMNDPYIIGVSGAVWEDFGDQGGDPSMFDLPRRTIDEVPLDFKTELNQAYVRKDGEVYKKYGMAYGCFTHILHSYYRYYRSTMDEQTGKNLFKLAKMNMRGFLYMMGPKRKDGKYHLDLMESPEMGPVPDANYGLSAIQWLCRTIMELDDRWQLKDPDRALWEDIRTNLADYPQTEKDGFVLGTGGGPNYLNRCSSHLFQIYPYKLVTGETEPERDLIRRSLKAYGVDYGNPGMSPPVNAAMRAMLGEGNIAADIHKKIYGAWAGPASLIEQSLIVAESIQNLFLQSYNGVIRVFPAMPDYWPEAVFHTMRAEGAFDVSAAWRGGKTEWILITSDAGEPCVVQTTLARPIEAVGARVFSLVEKDKNRIAIDLKKGETVLLRTVGTNPDLAIKPVAADDYRNWYPVRGDRPQIEGHWSRVLHLAALSDADLLARMQDATPPSVDHLTAAILVREIQPSAAIRDAVLQRCQARNSGRFDKDQAIFALCRWPQDPVVAAFMDQQLASVTDPACLNYLLSMQPTAGHPALLKRALVAGQGAVVQVALADLIATDHWDLIAQAMAEAKGRQPGILAGALWRRFEKDADPSGRKRAVAIIGDNLKQEDTFCLGQMAGVLGRFGADSAPYLDALKAIDVSRDPRWLGGVPEAIKIIENAIKAKEKERK